MSRGLFVAVAFGLTVLAGTAFVLGPATRTGAQFEPSFDYIEARGCFDIDVFTFNKAGTELLSVRIDLDPKNLPSASEPLVIQLADRPARSRVQVYVYGTEHHDWPCSDVTASPAGAPTTWTAIRGTLTVEAEQPQLVGGEYPVTLRIANAEFASPLGATIQAPRALEVKTRAGRLVGG